MTETPLLSGRRWPEVEMNEEPVTIEKEMAVTHTDFYRLLPNVLRGEDITVEGTRVRIEGTAGTWTIDLGLEGERRIALLVVPRTSVTLTFEDYSTENREDALKRFDRAFQRGGG